jgi:hypothetical protein
MNPYWAEHQAFKEGSETFADSAMSAIVFKANRSAFMKVIKHRQICEKFRRSSGEAILVWSDFGTHAIHFVEGLISVRYPKDSHLLYHEQMVTDFHQLIDSYRIRHH